MTVDSLRRKLRTWWTLAVSGIATAGIITVLLVSPAGADPVQISGNVSDQQGVGIANAEVRVLTPVIVGGYGYGTAGGDLVASTVTDSSGDYVTDITSDIYDIQVIPPAGSDFQGTTLENVSISQNTVIDFDLLRGVFLHYSFDGPIGQVLNGFVFSDDSGNDNDGTLIDVGVQDHQIITSPAGGFGQAVSDLKLGGNHPTRFEPDRIGFTTAFAPGPDQAWSIAFRYDMWQCPYFSTPVRITHSGFAPMSRR